MNNTDKMSTTTVALDLSMVDESISEIRNVLDTMMYGSEYLPDEVFNHLRTAYDKVCEAKDELDRI